MGDKIVLDGELSLNLHLDGTPDKVIRVTDYDAPVYDGITDVTPSNQVQILQTSGKVVTRNIVVNPIPSNYGLITWNGSVLTVS